MSSYQACIVKLLSYQPVKHLLKSCCTHDPVLYWLVHQKLVGG